KAAYGNVQVFAVFGGSLSTQGQTVALIKPTGSGDLLVNGVHYESSAPWKPTTNGQSLQLIDLTQDSSRLGNWTTDPVTVSTPGAPNSVAAAITPYDPLWLNEIHVDTVD